MSKMHAFKSSDLSHVKGVALLLLICLLPFAAWSKDETIDEESRSYLESIRKDSRNRKRVSFNVANRMNYSVLEESFDDPNLLVRRQSLLLAKKCVIKTTNTVIQQDYIERFLENIFEEDGKISIETFWLHDFLPEHYSAKARMLLGKQLQKSLKEYREGPRVADWDNLEDSAIPSAKKKLGRLTDIIKCIGYSAATEHMGLLKTIKDEFGDVFKDPKKKYVKADTYMMEFKNPWLGTPAWHAVITLARLGSQEDIELCIELIEGYPDFSAIDHFILPDVSTIYRSEITEYFYTNLDNETKYHGGAPHPISFSDTALRYLILRIDNDDVDIRQQVNFKSPDIRKQIKEYVRVKLNGDIKQLPTIDIRRMRFNSLRKIQTIVK